MLAEALRLIRVFHDMQQQELAAKLSISRSYLSEIEGGKKVPSIELLQKYSDHFNIPMSSILFFSENLDAPSRSSRAKSAIASKVLQFLTFVEKRTEK